MAFFNIDSQRAFIHEPPKYCRCAARQAYTDSQAAAIFYAWGRLLLAFVNGLFGSRVCGNSILLLSGRLPVKSIEFDTMNLH